VKGRSRSGASERLLASNLVVVGGSLAAGLLGFAFQAMISHQLRPSDYGAAFAAITLLTFIGLPASALTLLMARQTSRDRAAGHSASSAVLLRSGNRALLMGGVFLAFVCAGASPWIGAFFSIPTELILAVAVALPVALALPLLMGEFQGQQRFLSFSALNVGQAGLKLIAAIVLGLALGPVGVVLGLAVAAILSYGVAFWLLRRRLAIRFTQPWLGPALRYLAVILPSTLALSFLLSADVLLVRHFFSGREAGEYSAVAALGRAIFWGAGGVAAVLFPKVIYQESQGRSGSRIVGVSLGLVTFGGLAGFAVLGLVARPVLVAFAGSDYAAGASILPLYAIAMTLLGGASVLIATHQSRARAVSLSVLLPITVAEPILIVAFHHSLLQVVTVITISMAVLVIGLAVLMVGQASRRTSDDRLPPVALAEAQA
jgi:O-antigen/teichoic acid export membrane protein